MKLKRKSIIILMLSLLLFSFTFFTVSASVTIDEVINSNSVLGSEENELSPLSANAGCSNYDYQGMTMAAVCSQNGWSMSGNNIIDGSGATIGRYDPCTNSHQEPHFHLNATPGVHYIL